MSELQLVSGSQNLVNAAITATIYNAVLDILGDGGVILPLGDPLLSKLGASTFTSVQKHVDGIEAVFTWSEAPRLFDTAPDFQGLIPILTLNGSDEEADSPDDDYWSFGADGTAGNEPTFSMGAWVKIIDATDSVIFSKFDSGSNLRTYIFRLDDSDGVELTLYDESVSANPFIRMNTDSAVSEGVWHHIVCTYNGDETPTGITLYVDGVAPAQTASDNVNYVAFENNASLLRLGFIIAGGSVPSSFMDGSMAGGPLGPFATNIELTAEQVKRLYQMGARLLELV